MSNTPRNLTRNQLAEFLPNARAVRAFEQMLKQINELLPSDVATINRLIQETYIEAAEGNSKAQSALDILGGIVQVAAINAGSADSKATAALDSLSSIARNLELLANAPPARENNSSTTDYLDFALNPRFAATPGRVHWGSTGTLEIEMGGGNITQQVGEEFFTYGKATAAITEGQLIMVTGAVGASGVVTFAPTTTGLLDSNAILGVATENIALNGFGRVTMLGVVHGIDTTGSSVGEVWADGDVLWYNTAFVGAMTKVKPVAPNMKTQVAIVINAGSGGSGSLQVEVINGSTLGGTDANVQFGALADKQLIQYDAAAGYWKNVAVATVAEPPITAGTTAQYWRGDKSWQDFFTSVRAATLTGLSTATNAVITAADTVLSAFGKLQKQISDNLTTLTSHTGNTSNPHATTAAQVGALTSADLATPPAIGGTVPAAGTFTNLTVTLLSLLGGTTNSGSGVRTQSPSYEVRNTGGDTFQAGAYFGGSSSAGNIQAGGVAGTLDLWTYNGGWGRRLRVSLEGIYADPGTTGMTTGFMRIAAAAGAPTGAPSAVTGTVPMYYDTTNNKFYIYNGAWKSVTLT